MNRGYRTTLLASVALSGCTALVGLDKDYRLEELVDEIKEPVCEPETARACYSGPENTEKVGACKGGLQICNLDGTGYGECIGEVVPVAEDCATAKVDESCDGKTLCTGDLLWTNRFGDAGVQYSTSVTTDSAGNVLLTGHFAGNVDFGGGTLISAGNNDIFIAKLDPEGGLLWNKRFGDGGSQRSESITTDSADNVLLTGHFYGSVDFGGETLISVGNNDIFVAKLDPNGELLWSKRFGDVIGQSSYSITTDSTGNVLLTGHFYGSVDFGGGTLTSAGASDIFVAKLDSNGDPLWSKRFGDTGSQYSNSITTDSAGNVLLTGDFYDSLDFGAETLTSAGNNDIFVAKLDSNGEPLWSKRFGDASYQLGTSITTDSAGNVLLTGHFESIVDFGGGWLTSAGNNDIFVAKIDPDGDLLWSKRFGNEGKQSSHSVITDSGDNILLTGYFDGSVDFGGETLTSAGGHDIFVAKLDLNGDLLWSNRSGDTGNQSSTSITTDNADNVLLTGNFEGSVDFDDGTIPSLVYDIFVTKLAP